MLSEMAEILRLQLDLTSSKELWFTNHACSSNLKLKKMEDCFSLKELPVCTSLRFYDEIIFTD